MNEIIKLSPSEHEVAEKLQKLLVKHGCHNSIYFPTSKIEKGVDFIINKKGTSNVARVQVKSSTMHEETNKKYDNYLWLHNFKDRCKKGSADFYIIFGLPDGTKKQPFLCFSEDEMLKFLKGVKIKNGNPDSFIRIGFSSGKKIDGIYVLKHPKDEDISKYLLENKIGELKHFLNKGKP